MCWLRILDVKPQLTGRASGTFLRGPPSMNLVLVQGVGLTEGSETGRADRAEDIYDRYKQQYGEEAPPSGQGSSQSGRGQGTGGNATQQGSSKPASGGTEGSGDGMKPPPPTSRKEAVDKELEELKRKLGLK